jgi:hypothetical protein
VGKGSAVVLNKVRPVNTIAKPIIIFRVSIIAI